MTNRAGDIRPLSFYLETLAGVPVSFASLAAFTAAGFSFVFDNGLTLLSPQPSILSFTQKTLAGWMAITLTQPYGPWGVNIVTPFGFIATPSRFDTITLQADDDSLMANLSASIGTPSFAQNSTQTSYTISVPEFDSWGRQYLIPTSAMQLLDPSGGILYQWTNLLPIATVPWTIACSARYVDGQGPLPFNPIAFSLGASILNTNPGGSNAGLVGIGWTNAPAGALIDSFGATATAAIAGPGPGPVTTLTLTFGGMYYNTVPSVSIVDSMSGTGTGATAHCTITGVAPFQVATIVLDSPGTNYTAPLVVFGSVGDPTITQRTFNFDVRLEPPAGSTYASAKLTPITGQLILTRKQTT